MDVLTLDPHRHIYIRLRAVPLVPYAFWTAACQLYPWKEMFNKSSFRILRKLFDNLGFRGPWNCVDADVGM